VIVFVGFRVWIDNDDDLDINDDLQIDDLDEFVMMMRFTNLEEM